MDKLSPREKEYKFCPSCRTELIRKDIDRRKLFSCPNCSFVFWNNQVPATSIILEKQGKILMIKRNVEPLKDYWVLPGGYTDYDEKPEQSIIRETKEETNLNIKPTSLVGIYLIDNDPRGNCLDIIYHGSVIDGELKLEEDFSEYGFFSIEELPELIAYKHREAILDWKKKFSL